MRIRTLAEEPGRPLWRVPPRFPLQFAQKLSCTYQMIVENPARHFQQLADEGVAQGVSYRQAFFICVDDVLIPENSQLL